MLAFFSCLDKSINEMDGKKVYQIEINGIKESIAAVDALNRQLGELENRMKALEKSNVKVNASSSGGGGGSRSSLNEEEKIAKQIEQIDAKRKAYSKDIYQNYLAAKEVLKETVKDQQQIAAAERLQANTYSNTMQGMKDKLKDLQTLRQVTDISSDAFKQMTADANELVEKLKELEAQTGSFGRNVGNYQSAFDGLGKVSVTIGGVVQQFDSLKQATKALRDGMGVLESQGKKDTKMYKDMERELEKVSKAQLRLNSAMNDAKSSSKAMDDILDTFESFGAIGQVTQGFSTLFGIDSSEMEKQIAKLVALQNALKGIEKIRQQMNTQEGIGKIFSNASKGVDQFVAKLAGADYRMGKIIGSTKEASRSLMVFSNVLKGVGAVAVTGGFMVLSTLIGNLVEQFKKWYTGGIEAGDATKILASDVSTLDNTTERLLKTNTEEYFYGMADEASTATNQIEILTGKILELTSKIQESQGTFEKFDPTASWSTKNLKTLDDARDRFMHLAKSIEKIETNGKNSMFGETIYGWAVGLNGFKRTLKDLGSVIANDFMARAQDAIQKARNETLKFGYVTKDTAQEIKELEKEMNENRTTKGVLDNIEKFCDNSPRIINQLDGVRNGIVRLSNSLNTVDPAKMTQYIIDGMADSEEKIRKQNELNRKKEMESVGFDPQYTKVINDKYDRELQDSLKAYRKSKKQELDQKKKEERDVQNQIDDLKLQLMREGLAKEMKALQNERDQALREIADKGIRVKELSELTEKVYDKKLLELKRDWAYEMEEIYENMYMNIQQIENDAAKKQLNRASTELGTQTSQKKQNIVFDKDNAKDLNNRKIYYEDLLKIELDASNKELEIRQKNLDEQKRIDKEEEERRNKNVADAKTVQTVMAELSKIPEPSDADYAAIEQKLQAQLNTMRGELVDKYNQGKMDFKDFCDLIKKEQVAHNAAMRAIEDEYNADSTKALQDNLEEKQRVYNTYYQNVLATIRQKQDEIARGMQNTPIKDNDWGVVQISRTKEQYNSALEQYQKLAEEIKQQKANLKKSLDNKEITPDDFFMRSQELESMEKSVNDAVKNVAEKQKMIVADFVQSIQMYIQKAVESFNTIMNALWEANQNEFDKEQDQLDKLNEELDKKLSEQEALVEQHKSAIDSIEDELANSRGSRRQHLIDQLNAEMAAERAAAKQKQKIQKEQEKAQKRQDALDLKRKKAQYKRDLTQAIVNGAMAVTYAAINAWPIPAVPMMALAAATTAAQIAIMSANKPYAKGGQLEGGVAQGKRHRDGGIPVLGGRASIEGGEFITNRVTTQKNVEVLDFINSKHKKLTLDDFVDFYGGSKVRNNIISSTPKRVFEDGGVIPTLRNDYGIDDRLLTAIEYYNNRPVVVSVVDINKKQADVRRVQTLAGL